MTEWHNHEVLFTDRREAEAELARALSRMIPGCVARFVASQLFDQCDASYEADDWPHLPVAGPQQTVIGHPFDFLAGPWAIREKDLVLIAGLFPLLAPWTKDWSAEEVAKLLVSTIFMVWRLNRRGVHLDPLQTQILVALRAQGPLGLEDLVRGVRRPNSDWTPPEVHAGLLSLTAAKLNDGSVEPLVHQANDGRWSTDARGLWELRWETFG